MSDEENPLPDSDQEAQTAEQSDTPPRTGNEHDSRFKALIQERFADFVELCFPELVKEIDFSTVEWVSQEVFLNPPKKDKSVLDLIAKLKTYRNPSPELFTGDNDLTAIIFTEAESADSDTNINQKILFYFLMVFYKYRCPILPIVIFLRMVKKGIGDEVLRVNFFGFAVLEFRYRYIALAGLDPLEYLKKPNLLGQAFTSLMRQGQSDPFEVAKTAVTTIKAADLDDQTRAMLFECIEAYSKVSPEEKKEISKMMIISPSSPILPDNETTLQRWINAERAKGPEHFAKLESAGLIKEFVKHQKENAQREAQLQKENAQREAQLLKEKMAAEIEQQIREEERIAQSQRAQQSILRVVTRLFGETVASDLQPHIESTTNLTTLDNLLQRVLNAASPEELRQFWT